MISRKTMFYSLWMRRFAVASMISLAACDTVPDAYHVTRGTEPQNVDQDVRFRTTYYFRAFDRCATRREDPKKPISDLFSIKLTESGLAQIDSLYRFRMTGKASSIFSEVHFESGTLRASEIDPFGANVSFDDQNKQFIVRSAGEAKARADRSEKLREVQQLYNAAAQMPAGPVRDEWEGQILQLLRSLSDNPAGPSVMTQTAMATIVENAKKQVIDYSDKAKPVPGGKAIDIQVEPTKSALESVLPPTAKDQSAAQLAAGGVAALNALIQAVRAANTELVAAAAKPNADKGLSPLIEAAQGLLAKLSVSQRQLAQQLVLQNGGSPAAAAAGSPTPVGSSSCEKKVDARRGFQLLGPEGLKTFDQDERLLMAMSSDSKPLIGLLQELSSRVLGNKVNPSDRLLPIAQEQLHLSNAKVELSGNGQTPADLESAQKRLVAASTALKAK